MTGTIAPPQEFEAGLLECCAACSSKFHELLQLAAFWNPALGLYADFDSGSVLSRDASDVVNRFHSRVFSEWLCLPLADQFAEFAAYLTTLSVTGRQTFLSLLSYPRARDPLVPPMASAEEKALFASDLSTLAAMVIGE
jgi:hypothetical protein